MVTVLGARRGALAVLLFLLVVALGLPVLSGGRGGIGVFMGPSVGFLIGFPIAAFVAGLTVERLKAPIALALAMLHLTAGEEPAVRRQLAQAAAREGSHDFALRSRWAVALGFMGDRYAESGDFAAARVAYGRGLDVTPDNARLLQSRGNAERGAGDHPAAVASYERALILDRSNALIMVNLGIANSQ